MKKIYLLFCMILFAVCYLSAQKTTIHVQAEFMTECTEEQKAATVKSLENRINFFIENTVPKRKKKSSAKITLNGNLINVIINADAEMYQTYLQNDETLEKLLLKPGLVKVTEVYNYNDFQFYLDEINKYAAKTELLTSHYKQKAYHVENHILKKIPLYGILAKPSEIKVSTIGSALPDDTAIICKTFVQTEKIFPLNVRFYWTMFPQVDQISIAGIDEIYDLIAIKQPSSYEVKSYMIWPEKLRLAPSGFFKNAMNITITLQKGYRNYWEVMTNRNKGRALAVCIDNEVVSCPKVGTAVKNGQFEISSPYLTPQKTFLLASIIYGGKLPAELNILAIERK